MCRSQSRQIRGGGYHRQHSGRCISLQLKEKCFETKKSREENAVRNPLYLLMHPPIRKGKRTANVKSVPVVVVDHHAECIGPFGDLLFDRAKLVKK